MDRDKFSSFIKAGVIAIGAVCLTAAVATLSPLIFEWKFAIILGFSLTIAPRMSLTLPRSKFAISFSDALVFLTLIIYGGPAAVIVATVETAANCVFLRSNGFRFGKLMIPTNVSLNVIATTITYLAWVLLQQVALGPMNIGRTQSLITALGILALIQFLGSSWLAAAFQTLKDGGNLWHTWRRDCFTSSMTQIVGAGIAGLVFKLINFGDLVTAAIAFLALTLAFINYRQSIAEINQAIANVEEAERQKAETERQRRREAESYASELAVSLEKEARANDALRRSEKDFQYAALHDSLTGLANRKQLNDILKNLIHDYKEDPSLNFQVLFLDIRSFKNINDTLGHTIGDKVLTIAAKRFSRIVNPEDTVARIGGDEFAIVLRNLATTGKAQKVARKIYRSITQPFSLSGNKISIDVNIGIAPCDAEYETPEEILRDADIAMHYAKERREGPAVFTRELRHRFLERVRFEMDLRHAIDRQELSMNYQPIVSLSDGRLVGFEALLRWNHSELGHISPNRFIPIAEHSDLIQPITVWILRETTQRLAEWQKISPEYGDLCVSVNISGKHLSNDNLVYDVEECLELSGIDPASLKLEITESSAMENAERTINLLKRLKQLGVQLSIDDFGTGYSSLSYLHRLPFDSLKIDRSFVKVVGERGENSGILQTIISLAKNLKMRVIAEGIETESQLAVLQNLGCDYGQGYLLSKAIGTEEAEQQLYQHHNWLPFGTAIEVSNERPHNTNDELPVF